MPTDRRMVIGMSVIGAIAAAASVLFIIPNYREARTLHRQIADLQRRAGTLVTRSEVVDKLAHEVQLASEHAANDLKSIPDSPDVAGLIRKLSLPIDGVTVIEQTFTAGTPGEAIVGGEHSAMAMPLAADMYATFDSIMALINKAESMSRLVRVASVRLLCKRDEQKTDVPLLSASIGLEAVYDAQEPTHENK